MTLKKIANTADEIVVRREHASMFDAIDFATADPDDASWQLLGNIAKHTTVLGRSP